MPLITPLGKLLMHACLWVPTTMDVIVPHTAWNGPSGVFAPACLNTLKNLTSQLEKTVPKNTSRAPAGNAGAGNQRENTDVKETPQQASWLNRGNSLEYGSSIHHFTALAFYIQKAP